MTDDEAYKSNSTYLQGKVDHLEFLIREILATLPPDSTDFVVSRGDERAALARELAEIKQSDVARDHADAAWDVMAGLAEGIKTERDVMRDWKED